MKDLPNFLCKQYTYPCEKNTPTPLDWVLIMVVFSTHVQNNEIYRSITYSVGTVW